MRADLIVRGRMLRPDGSTVRAGFSVKDGRIHELRARAPAARTLDFGDFLLVPGHVDPHVHFRDPGHPEKEDFASGTRSAALGGVTTVLDMPNTEPPTLTPAALEEKRALARRKAAIDFGLFAGLDAAGRASAIFPDASAVKIYLGSTTGDLLVRDMRVVREALLAAAAAGRTVTVHAESQDCLDRHAHRADASFPSHAHARPPECEAEAIRALSQAAAGTGARVHVAHLSTRAGLDALAGTGFTAEVAPHHLLLNHERLRDGGRFKMNPPLRAQEDVAALWHALAQGRIGCLASDHAPHTPAEKDAAPMPACPAGVPGVATLVPVLIPFAERGWLPLPRLFEAASAAAEIFRLQGKGALVPGMDADFAAYDLGRREPVRAALLHSKAGWSPFEGLPACFPRAVWVRGEPVVEDGRVVGEPGRGRFVAPGSVTQE